jgi:hypothetical protein
VSLTQTSAALSTISQISNPEPLFAPIDLHKALHLYLGDSWFGCDSQMSDTDATHKGYI